MVTGVSTITADEQHKELGFLIRKRSHTWLRRRSDCSFLRPCVSLRIFPTSLLGLSHRTDDELAENSVYLTGQRRAGLSLHPC